MIDLHADKEHNKSKLNDQFFEGLCDLFFELGIDGHEFINDFTKHYVQRTSKKVKTKADVYNSTGFSEYTAKKHLDESEHKDYPKRKQYYLILINRLKELCERSDDGCIPINGLHRSYVSAFNDANSADNTFTSASMLRKLIRTGVVEKVGNKKIKFVSLMPTTGSNDREDVIKIFSNLINRASRTFLHNFLADKNDKTLFQMTYFSHAIHPDNHKKLLDWLRNEQRKDFKKYQAKIDSLEEKGLMRKMVESLNLEIGITALTFNHSIEEKT